MDTSDTIAAIATPSSPGLLGMVRISGPLAWSIALEGFEPTRPWPLPRRAEVRSGTLRIEGFRPISRASITLWPGPRTYTGEPLAELETVGSPPILQAILADRLSRGARLAEPGEFTLRAFLSGRIDLTQAEAVLGVIEADDPARLDSALRQLAGDVASPIESLRQRLLDVLAHLEAGLDFVDEADVNPLANSELATELASASETILALARQLSSRGRPDGRYRVVLVGPPNAGKSRLFNALIGSERAIVSPIAGTTRDYLSASCDCDGLIVELIDSAGVEPAVDPISRSARGLLEEVASKADLLIDCSSTELDRVAMISGPKSLRIGTKSDLGASTDEPMILTSAISGAGLNTLKSAIAETLRAQSSEGSGVAATAVRCRDGLDRAGIALRVASESIILGAGDEFVSFDVRQAVEELNRVVGAEAGDEILDRIFRRFCIGK